ncbi:MAG: macro domain-containing protein [Trueperaceae bacterium]
MTVEQKKIIPITYLKGDAIVPQAKGNKIIAHISNDLGGWGKGFVLALSKKWKEPERAYRDWHHNRANNDFALGAIQVVQVEPYIWVANMIGQRGIKTGRSTGVPVRYEAIDKCLEALTKEALKLGASIHMPRIGCGLAGGKWEKVEPLIIKNLCEQDIEVFIYDWS